MSTNSVLLEVRDLYTYFYTDEGVVKAVDGVDLKIGKCKVLCLMGESACGKSVTALSIMRLVPRPGRIIKGKILYHQQKNGKELIDFTQLDPMGTKIRNIRGKEIAMVFQEPMSSLNPVYTIGEQITEAIMLHQQLNKEEAKEQAIELLNKMSIPMPHRRINQYPHELSGGIRQRAMFAMALSCNPSLLIADEPTTALDVTTQAQIIELTKELQDEFKMAVLLITHNSGVVAEMADEVAVMYLGKIFEHSDLRRIFHSPKHPYTRALLESIPFLGHTKKRTLKPIRGDVPGPFMSFQGCTFAPRCSECMEVCLRGGNPPLIEVEKGHEVRCWLYQ